MKYFLILITFLLNYTKAALHPENVILAINCGGESVKDSKGIIYSKVLL